MKDPLISIVLPTFERANSLKESITSVLNQTFEDFELLVVDDGSTDHTSALVEALAAKDSRLRSLQQPHLGASSARNKGMELARGFYIAFQDSDDLWLPEKLAKQINFFHERVEADFIYCTGYFTDQAGGRHEFLTERLSPKRQYSIEDILFSRARMLTPGVLFKRTALARAGMFDETMPFFEDWHFWFRMFLHSKTEYLDEELVIIRGYAEKMEKLTPEYYFNLAKYNWDFHNKIVRIFEKDVRALTEKERQQALYDYQLQFIKQCILSGRRSEARGQLREYGGSSLRAVPYHVLSLLPADVVARLVNKWRSIKYRDKTLSKA